MTAAAAAGVLVMALVASAVAQAPHSQNCFLTCKCVNRWCEESEGNGSYVWQFRCAQTSDTNCDGLLSWASGTCGWGDNKVRGESKSSNYVNEWKCLCNIPRSGDRQEGGPNAKPEDNWQGADIYTYCNPDLYYSSGG